MAQVKFHKYVAALPAQLEANAIYYVRAGDGFDMYVTNGAGMIVAYPANYAKLGDNTTTRPMRITKNGHEIGALLYTTGNLELITQDGSPPSIGLHRGGVNAGALYLTMDTQVGFVSNAGQASVLWSDANAPARLAAMGVGTPGTYASLQNLSGALQPPGSIVSGSVLRYASHNNASTIAPDGSWKCMGNANAGGVTTWMRI
ncbi:hypothetical protein DN820_01725 [Stutzerimonas nosocomialis]|uniref:Uncharacterized protein n=1 Tax=Stutzerimonas nosocomialis TaxID=1056496 RepID=A0A5R9QIX7_9GAMM|nr:hypothetical protein [Stutzerimonas nosocomialis]TLX65058.1 hypothetical protein DN820_01725 [Stutzerimonas nosocomialis]